MVKFVDTVSTAVSRPTTPSLPSFSTVLTPNTSVLLDILKLFTFRSVWSTTGPGSYRYPHRHVHLPLLLFHYSFRYPMDILGVPSTVLNPTSPDSPLSLLNPLSRPIGPSSIDLSLSTDSEGPHGFGPQNSRRRTSRPITLPSRRGVRKEDLVTCSS